VEREVGSKMTNRYTDFVLSVIALCLVVLVVKSIFETRVAYADEASAGTSGVQKVNIVEIGGWELLSRAALPVEIESGPVPVELVRGESCGCP
jgi:hypothetical protein